MSAERDEVDPPHHESSEDSDGDVRLDLDDAPLADPTRPGSIPNDTPETG